MMTSSTGCKVRLLENGMLDAQPTDDLMKISIRNLKQSPLLRLPAELRNLIYAQVFIVQDIICVNGPYTDQAYVCGDYIDRTQDEDEEFTCYDYSDWRGGLEREDFSSFCHVQQVCRTIYAETALFPFALNNFGLNRGGAATYKRKLLPAQLNSIGSVVFMTLRRVPPVLKETLPILDAFKRVQSITWHHQYGDRTDYSDIEPCWRDLENEIKSQTSAEVKIGLFTPANPPFTRDN